MATSIVSAEGQTVIPAKIREWLKLEAGDKIAWVHDGQTVHIVRLPEDPLKALQGSDKGGNLLELLLEERRLDREREDRDWDYDIES